MEPSGFPAGIAGAGRTVGRLEEQPELVIGIRSAASKSNPESGVDDNLRSLGAARALVESRLELSEQSGVAFLLAANVV